MHKEAIISDVKRQNRQRIAKYILEKKQTSTAVMSALLFGIYHGNVLQGAYGFFMGILLAWVMERRRTISAPVLMHMSANMTSVVMTLA